MTVVTSARIVQKTAWGSSALQAVESRHRYVGRGTSSIPLWEETVPLPLPPKKTFDLEKNVFFVDKALIKKFFKTILGCI